MFHACSGVFTKLHISGHICPNLDSDIFRILVLPVQVMQHLLFKSGSSFKSVFRSVWNIFLFLFWKWTFKIVFFEIVFNNNNNNNSIPSTLARHPSQPHYTCYTRHPHKHTTYATYAGTPPTPPTPPTHGCHMAYYGTPLGNLLLSFHS